MIEKLKAEVAALKLQLIENGLTPILNPGKKMSAAAVDDISQETSADLNPSAQLSNSNQTPVAPSNASTSLDEQEESKGEPGSSQKRTDVSFNTLLDDSTLSFNPDSAPTESAAGASTTAQDNSQFKQNVINATPPITKQLTQREQNKVKNLQQQVSDQLERITELETEYQAY